MTAEMGDLAGAGSSVVGGLPAAPAGAVVIPVEAAAPAAAPAPAARAWTRVSASASATVTTRPAAPPAWWTRLTARLALAAALFLLGCAAAGLAFFAIILRPTGKVCVPTDGEVASLRTASGYLLLAASSQVLAATMGLVVPARPFAVLGALLGLLTSYHADDVLEMLVTCHGSSHAALDLHLWIFWIVLWVAIVVGVVVSLR